MNSQGLTANHTKAQLLPITCSRKALLVNIVINGHLITPSSSVKYLGVTISSDLSWSEHITSIRKKAWRHLGYINRRFNWSPQPFRTQLYKSAMLPKLDYCRAVWDSHHRSDVSALENIQKFAARVTTRQWKLDYESIQSSLHWKPLSLQRKIQKLSLFEHNEQSFHHPWHLIRHPHPSPSPTYPC